MPVYVDEITEYPTSVIEPAARRCGRLWCHMWCDAGDEEALHLVAARIGMKRAWYQHHGKRWPHYDLTPRRRELALQHGAVAKNWREWYKENFMPGKDKP